MIDLGEVIALTGLVIGTGFVISGFAGAWLHGRAKGRREGLREAQELMQVNPRAGGNDERLDSLLLEVTRLREKQSQMSRLLNANLQATTEPQSFPKVT
jgi:hypothetical protein